MNRLVFKLKNSKIFCCMKKSLVGCYTPQKSKNQMNRSKCQIYIYDADTFMDDHGGEVWDGLMIFDF